jgi:hypothetical protein
VHDARIEHQSRDLDNCSTPWRHYRESDGVQGSGETK